MYNLSSGACHHTLPCLSPIQLCSLVVLFPHLFIWSTDVSCCVRHQDWGNWDRQGRQRPWICSSEPRWGDRVRDAEKVLRRACTKSYRNTSRGWEWGETPRRWILRWSGRWGVGVRGWWDEGISWLGWWCNDQSLGASTRGPLRPLLSPPQPCHALLLTRQALYPSAPLPTLSPHQDCFPHLIVLAAFFILGLHVLKSMWAEQLWCSGWVAVVLRLSSCGAQAE